MTGTSLQTPVEPWPPFLYLFLTSLYPYRLIVCSKDMSLEDTDLVEDNVANSMQEWWDFQEQLGERGVDLSRNFIIKTVMQVNSHLPPTTTKPSAILSGSF